MKKFISTYDQIARAGEARGEARGERQGRVVVLERLLIRRFGPLPRSAAARLRTAAIEDLETWTERLLDATTLAGVFAAD